MYIVVLLDSLRCIMIAIARSANNLLLGGWWWGLWSMQDFGRWSIVFKRAIRNLLIYYLFAYVVARPAVDVLASGSRSLGEAFSVILNPYRG